VSKRKPPFPAVRSAVPQPTAAAHGAAPRLTLPQILERAVSAYNAGQWTVAEQFCRMILSASRDHFETLNLLGVICAQMRRTGEAAALMGKAVALRPRDAAAHNNYGNVLKELGRFNEALASYDRAVKIKAAYPEAHYNRGVVLQAQGRFDDAQGAYERALELRPGYLEAWCNRGNVLFELRRLDAALLSYERALALRPDYSEALYNRGNALQALMRLPEALASYDRALELRADYPETFYNRGNVLHELQRLPEALHSFDRAIALRPDFADALCNRGNVLQELQRVDEALASYEQTLRIEPARADAHCNRGNVLKTLRRLDEALTSYERALTLEPGLAEAHLNRAAVLRELGRRSEALASVDRALALDAGRVAAHFSRGNVLKDLEDYDEAVASYDRALALEPTHADAWNNRGNALQSLGRFEDALESYERALAVRPDFADACSNLGNALQRLQRFDDALASYEHALAFDPGHADAQNGRGNALQELGRIAEALVCYERILENTPDFADAHVDRGRGLKELNRLEAALASYERALRVSPDYEWLYGNGLHTRMQLADWSDFEARVGELAARLEQGKKAAAPFPVLALVDSPDLQRRAAEIWVREKAPPRTLLGPLARYGRREKIRLGYLSADFRHHPVAMLIAEVLERHDRTRFEVTALSLGAATEEPMRRRIERAVDRFIDVRARSDRQIAELARRLQLDIAIDLGGFTDGARPALFALRAAPLQVSYLGYLGTLGAPYMDYLIADPTLIPASHRHHYAEKILYLPSYQANDSQRAIAEKHFTREELGLPPEGVVFCCFNASYKITPPTFDSWMRILRQVPGSVLWLLAERDSVERNLRQEAQARGVDAARLVFAQRLPLPEYLARYRAADLFLDTLPYNAGTTASDALWAGLPVLTRRGEAFAARLAASLLEAIGLPELVTTSAEHYETLAVELASHPQRRQALRAKLAANRSCTPLFDTAAFTGHLEHAYLRIHERQLAGLPPEHCEAAP
jgi:predicted O-linked N-acetylglucosamine transferase (SPINDLY family)